MPAQSATVVEGSEPVVAGDPEFARVRAGWVRLSGQDVAWVLADLAPALAGVEVFCLRGESELLRDKEFRWSVEGVAVSVHIADAAAAGRVAGMFGLVGVDKVKDSGRQWRTWTGWVSDAGREFPVCLRITACVKSVSP